MDVSTRSIGSDTDLDLLVAPPVKTGPGSPRLDGCDWERILGLEVEARSSSSNSVGSSGGGDAIAITEVCDVKARFGIEDRRVPEAEPTTELRVEDLVALGDVLLEVISFLLWLSGVTTPIEVLIS
jgi:hypothetical protein